MLTSARFGGFDPLVNSSRHINVSESLTSDQKRRDIFPPPQQDRLYHRCVPGVKVNLEGFACHELIEPESGEDLVKLF